MREGRRKETKEGERAGADDDVQDNVRVRLEKLEVMISEKNNQ